MYVIFEGIDGAGKTTQSQRLCNALSKLNYTGIQLSEPTYGEYGRQIRMLLSSGKNISKSEQRQLFTLDRTQHVQRKIRPLLMFIRENPGFVLVQDRSYLSAPAYQAGSEDEIKLMLNEQHAIAPKPDVIFLLDVPVDVALARKARIAEPSTFFEKVEILEEVRKRYLYLAIEGSNRIELIDGTQTPDSICDLALKHMGYSSCQI